MFWQGFEGNIFTEREQTVEERETENTCLIRRASFYRLKQNVPIILGRRQKVDCL